MQTVKTILLILVYIVFLSACGYKGPLYLPDESTTAKQSSEQDSTAANGEEESKGEKESGKKEKDISA